MKATFSEEEQQALQTCRNALAMVAEGLGPQKKLGSLCIELITALQKKRIYLIAVDKAKYEAWVAKEKEG